MWLTEELRKNNFGILQHLSLERLLVGPALLSESLRLFYKHLVCCILYIAYSRYDIREKDCCTDLHTFKDAGGLYISRNFILKPGSLLSCRRCLQALGEVQRSDGNAGTVGKEVGQ